jgi:hypothetical protein
MIEPVDVPVHNRVIVLMGLRKASSRVTRAWVTMTPRIPPPSIAMATFFLNGFIPLPPVKIEIGAPG